MPRNVSNSDNYSLFALSASNAETGVNVAQTIDLSVLLEKGNIYQPVPIGEMNTTEANGLIGPDRYDYFAETGKMPFNFKKLKPSEAAIILAYSFGDVATVPAGTSGYKHTITERGNDVEQGVRSLPTFTGMQQLGKIVDLKRIYSLAMTGGSFTFTRNKWLEGSGDAISTGKTDEAYSTETVAELDNSTTLTLPTAVEGATAQERLDNVHSVMGYYNGAWRELKPTEVSDATPAVVTIPSLGGSGATINYEVIYAETYPAWANFPDQIIEPALRVVDMCIWVGGTWNGSEFIGGYPLSTALDTFEWSFSNNQVAVFIASNCDGGGEVIRYAGMIRRGDFTHTINVTHDMYEVILEEWRRTGRYFGLWVLCEGPEYEAGHNYTLENIWPRIRVIDNTRSSKEGHLSNKSMMQPLVDPAYGRIISNVKNMWPQYAALS